jgi:hypothetical protein
MFSDNISGPTFLDFPHVIENCGSACGISVLFNLFMKAGLNEPGHITKPIYY